MTLENLYYTLPEIEKRWEKTQNLLFQWAEKEKLKISTKVSFLASGRKPYSGYLTIKLTDIGFFANHEQVYISEFVESEGQTIHPIETTRHLSGGGISSRWGYENRPPDVRITENISSVLINRAHLVIMAEEVERMERKYPELSPTKIHKTQTISPNLDYEFNEEIPTNLETHSYNKKLLPSERKSLLKILYVMAVKGFGYDPEEKKSAIPGALADLAHELDLAITDDTIRKWLKEAATLKRSNELA